MAIQRKVKFEEELDKNFLDEIKDMSGCEEIDQCIQCGVCSSSCPMAVYMDHPPQEDHCLYQKRIQGRSS